MTVHSRSLQSINQPMPTRYNNALIPVSSSRSLLSAMYDAKPVPMPFEQPFIDEKEAVEEILASNLKLPGAVNIAGIDQSGEGILDVVTVGAKALSNFVPGALGSTLAAAASTVGKVKLAAEALKVAGKVGSELAFGKVGTTISNVLSEKFNKNPAWKPGFPGEQHLVLNTPHGLTRANFCGPKTQLLKRLNRGDVGVNQIDTACEKHDLLYHFAKTKEDIRRADEQMIRDVGKVTDAGVAQKAIISAGIRAKTIGEDIGVFGPETFTSLPGLEGKGITDRMFLGEAPRHMGSIFNRVHNLPVPTISQRFGGNGITRGNIISGDNLRGDGLHPAFDKAKVGAGLRKTGLLGNVKGKDPTISGMNTSFISGTGRNNLIRVFPNSMRSQMHLGQRGLEGRGLQQQETRDLSGIKAVDPTISNLISGQPSGMSGIKGNLSASATVNMNDDLTGSGAFNVGNPAGSGGHEISRPVDKLKKHVLQDLRRARKKEIRDRRHRGIALINKNPGVSLAVIRNKQKGGQLIPLAIAAATAIPALMKLFGAGKKADAKRRRHAASASKFLTPSIINAINAMHKQKGSGNFEDFFKFVGQDIKRGFSGRGLYTTNTRKKISRGRNLKIPITTIGKKSQLGKGPASKLALRMAAAHGITPAKLGVSAAVLGPLIHKALKGKKGKGQEGGQLGLIAGLAASLILPKIIKSLKKK